MSIVPPSLTLGVEEEYLLVDPETRDLVTSPPAGFMQACKDRLGDCVGHELLQAQIEVGTPVCQNIQDIRRELIRLRLGVAETARDFGMVMMASSTHPFARCRDQARVQNERYDGLISDLRALADRMLICGMHVHIGIDDDDLRIDLMNQVTYFLPHLLALSTSSPFWQGQDTGLRSYRMAVWKELPRTGLPPSFRSYGEYRRTVGTLIEAGVIEDTSKIWWDVRPSAQFPTLEMRMTDICTRLEDTICIAALFRCLLRMLWRLRQDNQRWRGYDRFMVAENVWRAQRYGIDEGLIDFGKRQIVPYATLFEEILRLIREDAEHFDCVAEVEHGRTIIEHGSSAHRQVARWNESKGAGNDEHSALQSVVDLLREETAHGL